MVHRLHLLFAALLLVPASAALGQSAEEPALRSPDDIIVEGERLTEKEARQRAHDFIRTLGVAPGIYADDSVARWTGELCPRALGLSEDHAALVEGWFRAIAQDAAADVAKDKCSANVFLLFVDDGSRFINLIRTRSPGQFAAMSGPDIRDLVERERPIRWWYSVRLETGGASLIKPASIRSIERATIVIDVNRAEGATLRAVTAYAAFVALAGVRGTAAPKGDSILALFDGRPGQAELSRWDRRFLTELYAMPHERRTRYQRGRLVKALVTPEEDTPR
ncbi:MAG: hypothetical protein DI569_00785 [Sphingopyxis macrogoltabida]|uniref:Uncharacterized protein n=1 Tax=Sphingopyxis macrogoltabida TaxID=33050 RepID=A0A2W5LCN3_SPHMC|nr:MAG: hypothetical protein DI569_00785 [Sphingopyxis macrogoltabida]